MALIDEMDFDQLMAFEEQHSIALGSPWADASPALLTTLTADTSGKRAKPAVNDLVPAASQVGAKKKVKFRARKSR